MTRSKNMVEEDEKTTEYTSVGSVTSDDDFIIIEEDDIQHTDDGAQDISEKANREASSVVSHGNETSPLGEETTPSNHPLPLTYIQQCFLRGKTQARQSLCQKLEHKGFQAIFDFDQSEVNIQTHDGNVDAALKIIRESVVEMKVDFTEEELQKMAVITDIRDEEALSSILVGSSDREVIVVIDQLEKSMKIVGLTDTLDEVGETISKTLELLKSQSSPDNVSKSEPLSEEPKTVTVPVRESVFDYVEEYQLDEILALTTDASGLSIDITEDGIVVSGPATPVDVAVEDIKARIGQIRSDKFTLGAGINMGMFAEASKNAGKNHNVLIAYKQKNTPRGQAAKVTVVLNRIERQQADVLVNTTNKQLNLREGNGISNSILKAAGNVIQEQLAILFPHGMTYGDLATSGPGNLTNCRSIYHAALPNYHGPGEKMDLSRCYEASGELHQSISFPAFGTGALQYPVKNVAQLIFSAIDRFNQDQRAGCIKNIYIVISPESRLETKQDYLLLNKSESPTTSRKVGKANHPKCEVRAKIGETLLQVLHGDINKMCNFTDTVMVPWFRDEIATPNDKPGLKMIDPDRQDWSCNTYVAELPRAKCTADSTTLPGKTLIHTYCPTATEKNMTSAIKEGLKEAVRQKYVLAAFPKDTTAAIVSAISGYSSGMFVVTIVIPTDNIFIDFASKLAAKKKLEVPADITMTHFIDTLWSVTYSGQAARSLTQTSALNMGVDSSMVVTSNSEERNRAAVQEVAKELNTSLCHVLRSHSE